MRIAIVILNWNGSAFLQKFLPEVIEHSWGIADVYVIDNNSTDDSLKILSSSFSSVKVIQNIDNYGFARGYNEGLKHVKADYFVLLNSDVQVTGNWIQPIVDLMDSDKAIAACQPKLLNYNIRDEFEYAGAAGGFIDKWGYPFCRGRLFDAFEKDKGQYDDTREIFWASGACLFVRAPSYFEAGGFDEDFYIHMEEIDLCWRLGNLGYKIVYCAQSTIYHVGAGTLEKSNPKKTFYNFRNNMLMVIKNHAPEFFGIKLILRAVLDGVAALRFLFSGQLGQFYAILRAHGNVYASLGKTMRKRSQIQKSIKNYASGSVYRKSIVWEYFVKGKRKFSELDQKFL